ncbi:DUF3795 domain-containing protein [Christensenellaceae bacterium OttesenSCG-928-M15]|nr:DUF3795 domain-containing protein [Christensenellaceae bacterium OttesenSCG-928-M15]
MKMPPVIEAVMLAPCGMNCTVCYKHVQIKKRGQHCQGCLLGDEGKPEHCRSCKIKTCAKEKGVEHCFSCADFPCKLIKSLEKSYTKRYGTSLIANSNSAKDMGVSAFLSMDRGKWLCSACGGVYSLHDGVCSECGAGRKD